MNLNETKIEWCTHTWNPITGCCHGCHYCYARRQVGRFAPHGPERPMADESGETGLLEDGSLPAGCYQTARPVNLMDETGAFVRNTPYPKGFAPTLHSYKLDEPIKHQTPARIFVCSMADLFGDWVSDEWIKAVFDACKQAPQHTYMFLTKNPSRYGRLAGAGELPNSKNFWYGVTATDHQTAEFSMRYLPPVWRYNLFMSVEPMLGSINLPAAEQYPKWIIIGAMTGPGCKKHQPERQWIETIVEEAHRVSVPIFMKDSLAPIWGAGLIREYPLEMPKVTAKPAPLPRCKTCEHAESVQQGKRGTSRSCVIGWTAEGYEDRGSRHILGRYTRTSPPWCPRRKKEYL